MFNFDSLIEAVKSIPTRIKFDQETRLSFTRNLESALKHRIDLEIVLENMIDKPLSNEFKEIAEIAYQAYKETGHIISEVGDISLSHLFPAGEFSILKSASLNNDLVSGLGELNRHKGQEKNLATEVLSPCMSLIVANVLFIVMAIYMAVAGQYLAPQILADRSIVKIGEVVILLSPLITFAFIALAITYVLARAKPGNIRAICERVGFFVINDLKIRLRLLRQLKRQFGFDGNFAEAINHTESVEQSTFGLHLLRECITQLGKGDAPAMAMRGNLMPGQHANIFGFQSSTERREAIDGALATVIETMTNEVTDLYLAVKRKTFLINGVIFLLLLSPIIDFILLSDLSIQ